MPFKKLRRQNDVSALTGSLPDQRFDLTDIDGDIVRER
jgi:hypothetical protein